MKKFVLIAICFLAISFSQTKLIGQEKLKPIPEHVKFCDEYIRDIVIRHFEFLVEEIKLWAYHPDGNHVAVVTKENPNIIRIFDLSQEKLIAIIDIFEKLKEEDAKFRHPKEHYTINRVDFPKHLNIGKERRVWIQFAPQRRIRSFDFQVN